jgi:hypothetical protein
MPTFLILFLVGLLALLDAPFACAERTGRARSVTYPSDASAIALGGAARAIGSQSSFVARLDAAEPIQPSN